MLDDRPLSPGFYRDLVEAGLVGRLGCGLGRFRRR
jgi:hypothetical protein